MAFPTLDVDIPYLTTEQMVEVDRLMIEQYRIELIQMMENAGRGLALVAKERFLDGIIGYSLSGTPRGTAKAMIDWANQTETPVLSLDTPSGIDLTESKNYEPTVKADATLILALPKQGLRESSLRPYVGELYLADISVPPSLYAEPSLDLYVPSRLFALSDVVRIY